MPASAPPDPASTLHGLDEELITHPRYRWENHRRGDSREAVVQQTLAGAAFFEDPAGRRLVPAGHAMLFTHSEPSTYGYPPEVTEPYRQRYLSFGLGALHPWFERLRRDYGAVVRMSLDGEASAIFVEIQRRLRTHTFRDHLHESELLHQLLIALYREQVAASQARDPIEYGHHYLRDHYRTALNLKSVADRCGVSREHFIRAFRQRYGEPPGELLRRLRLEHAQRMLRSTQIPVQDIALACGFADANTFCRAYRRRYGTTPGASR